MARAYVYAGSLALFTFASILTIASINIPRWISYHDTAPDGSSIAIQIGLHRQCSSTTGTCSRFPETADCNGPDRSFCSLWRSVGFLMSFNVVLEGAMIIAFITILIGGRPMRERGWKLMSFFLFLVALIQCAGMALVAYLYDWDDRFFVGWKLDVSWICATVSWAVSLLLAVVLAGSGLLLPPEGGYEWLK